MTDTKAGTPPREARNALLRALQDEGIVGRKRQRIEDAADRFATATLDAARSRPATDPAGLDAAGHTLTCQLHRHLTCYCTPARARLSVADGPGPEERPETVWDRERAQIAAGGHRKMEAQWGDAEEACQHGRSAHTESGCLHCPCRVTYDGPLAALPEHREEPSR